MEERNRQIQEINANLEKMVETRTHAVLAARKELDTFLYQSAHALRRPLKSIEGLFSILKPGLDLDENQAFIQRFEETVANMDKLLQKLVMVNEIEARVPEIQPFSLDAVLEECTERLDWGTVHLQKRSPDGKKLVSDRDFILWLLLDLLENAIQYRRGEEPFVEVLLEEEETHCFLRVRDNGRGIPADQIKKVWAMFHRADVQQGGSGLGLYLVGRIVEKLYGTVEVESTAGVGTTVSIRLPLHHM